MSKLIAQKLWFNIPPQGTYIPPTIIVLFQFFLYNFFLVLFRFLTCISAPKLKMYLPQNVRCDASYLGNLQPSVLHLRIYQSLNLPPSSATQADQNLNLPPSLLTLKCKRVGDTTLPPTLTHLTLNNKDPLAPWMFGAHLTHVSYITLLSLFSLFVSSPVNLPSLFPALF